ncbi:hypothetical protein BDQ17DRAFT_1328872 [Cyathus striatus]|nr:hypothetical protein BDQ17DRAFT_1328872 [Cyathus striatus]
MAGFICMVLCNYPPSSLSTTVYLQAHQMLGRISGSFLERVWLQERVLDNNMSEVALVLGECTHYPPALYGSDFNVDCFWLKEKPGYESCHIRVPMAYHCSGILTPRLFLYASEMSTVDASCAHTFPFSVGMIWAGHKLPSGAFSMQKHGQCKPCAHIHHSQSDCIKHVFQQGLLNSDGRGGVVHIMFIQLKHISLNITPYHYRPYPRLKSFMACWSVGIRNHCDSMWFFYLPVTANSEAKTFIESKPMNDVVGSFMFQWRHWGYVFIHHQLTVEKLFDYPPGEIIEYPEAAISANGTVAHHFSLNQDDSHPKFNMQYSVGNKHGAVDYVFCGELLLDPNGKLVQCQKLTMSCRGLKQCEYDLKGSVNSYSPSAPDNLGVCLMHLTSGLIMVEIQILVMMKVVTIRVPFMAPRNELTKATSVLER